MLAEHSISVNEEDKDGDTPLFGVVRSKNWSGVRALVDLGASLSHINNKGKAAQGCAKKKKAIQAMADCIAAANPSHALDDKESTLKQELPRQSISKKPQPEGNEHALSQYVVIKLSCVLSDVFLKLENHCVSMMEAEVMSKRVVGRLKGVFQQLFEVNVVEQEAILTQYTSVIERFDQLLVQHGGFDFAMDLAVCIQLVDDVFQFHKGIDQVESALSLPRSLIPVEAMKCDQIEQLAAFGMFVVI